MRPGEIDNSDVLLPVLLPIALTDPCSMAVNWLVVQDSTDRLRENLRKGADFALLSEALWIPLSNWYGGGPAIPRRVIRAGTDEKASHVRLHGSCSIQPVTIAAAHPIGFAL